MNDELAHLRKRLEEEGQSMLAYFDALRDADWEQPVYADGSGWQVRHVLAHFVSAEKTYLFYVRRNLEGGEGLPADFDIDRFNESQVPELSRRPIAELKAELRSARADSMALVAGLTPADLDRRGRHPWLGEADLRSILKLLYRHPMIHLRDVRAALRTGAPVAREAEGGGDR